MSTNYYLILIVPDFACIHNESANIIFLIAEILSSNAKYSLKLVGFNSQQLLHFSQPVLLTISVYVTWRNRKTEALRKHTIRLGVSFFRLRYRVACFPLPQPCIEYNAKQAFVSSFPARISSQTRILHLLQHLLLLLFCSLFVNIIT